ncbi:hypothetical protein R1flu_026824 [Riccia fluitans]|uniref:Uncharacterized protein n=1 Tax=Riccia fluitans TaxID=41844 RepID=A0ABD1XJX7_9MARC
MFGNGLSIHFQNSFRTGGLKREEQEGLSFDIEVGRCKRVREFNSADNSNNDGEGGHGMARRLDCPLPSALPWRNNRFDAARAQQTTPELRQWVEKNGG